MDFSALYFMYLNKCVPVIIRSRIMKYKALKNFITYKRCSFLIDRGVMYMIYLQLLFMFNLKHLYISFLQG